MLRFYRELLGLASRKKRLLIVFLVNAVLIDGVYRPNAGNAIA